MNQYRFAALVVGGSVLLGLYSSLSLPLNHDVGWFLFLSARVLDGADLYVDLIEVNPPLVVWLGLPIVVIERLLGFPHTALFPVVVALAAGLSLRFSFRQSAEVLPEAYRAPFLGALAVALFVIPADQWGQREHLLLVMTLPYLVRSAARARAKDPGMPWGIGAAAGIGFALKPQFLLIPLMLETWLLLRGRRISHGTVAGAAMVIAYPIAVLIVTPGYLPMLLNLSDIYVDFRSVPLSELIFAPRSLLILVGLPWVFIRGEGSAARTAFGLAATGAWVAAIAQGKGFSYHFVPGLAMIVLIMTLALIGVGSGRRNTRTAWAAPLAFTIPAIAVAIALPPHSYTLAGQVAEIQAVAAGQPVIVMGRRLSDAWPVINHTDAEWVLATPSLWPLATNPEGERYGASLVVAALESSPVVLIPNRPQRDPVAQLYQHESFRAAWADYLQTDSLTHYRVFKAQPALQCPR